MEYAEIINLCYSLQPRIKRLLSLFCREEIDVEIIPHGESFTNLGSNYIRVSINAEPENTKEENCLIAKFISYHEGSHRRWTNQSESDKLISLAVDLARDIIESDGCKSDIDYKGFVFYILNSLEDGRIENILVNEYKGIQQLRDWYRMRELQSFKMTDDYSPLALFLGEVLAIATTGMHLPGFCDIYPAGTEENNAVMSILPHIAGYVSSRCVSQGQNDYLKIVEVITCLYKDSIKSQFSNQDNTEPLQLPEDVQNTIKDILENETQKSNSSDSTESSSNSKIIGILSDNGMNGTNENIISPDIILDLRDKINDNNDKFQNDVDNLADYITSQVKKIQDELQKEEAAEEERETQRQERLCEAAKAGKTDISNEELAVLSQAIGISSLNSIEINQINSYPKTPCDSIIKKQASKVRKKIEEYLKDNGGYITGRYEGSFDVNAASKFIIGRQDVFFKEYTPVETDACCMIIKDDSSSMRGDLKEPYAIRAISELEEMLKGIIPLKISTFSTSSDTHFMKVIKDWQTNDFSRNYCQSYGMVNDPSGGTNDDFAIMNASAQLLKRPEKQKMLIVISDGESAYPDYVTKAVKYARKNKIFLVSLFIGAPEVVKQKRAAFEKMYEKYFSCCTPDELAAVMVSYIKIFIKHI